MQNIRLTKQFWSLDFGHYHNHWHIYIYNLLFLVNPIDFFRTCLNFVDVLFVLTYCPSAVLIIFNNKRIHTE